jgi:hypothetical protein
MSDTPRSAADKAMGFLFLHDSIAGSPRTHSRALLVDNGERGSAQKAATFDGDDLSALMQDYASLERELAEARKKIDDMLPFYVLVHDGCRRDIAAARAEVERERLERIGTAQANLSYAEANKQLGLDLTAARAQVEAAFRAGYHCVWLKDEGRYTFVPDWKPGDPDSAYAAWSRYKKEKS